MVRSEVQAIYFIVRKDEATFPFIFAKEHTDDSLEVRSDVRDAKWRANVRVCARVRNDYCFRELFCLNIH